MSQRNKEMSRTDWRTLSFEEKQKLYNKLSEEMSLHKRQLFLQKVRLRTRHFSLALEDMMKSQNASALMRTADAFGVHRVDVFDKSEKFRVSSGISKGAEKWIEADFHNTYNEGGKKEWAEKLKNTGRKLYVTTLSPTTKPLELIDPLIPATICFGNEQDGASQELIDSADELVYIPMHGFSESFNVSVSCGIVLHHLTLGAGQAGIMRGLLPEDEITTLIQWALRTVRDPQRFI